MKKGFIIGLATGLIVAGASLVLANSQIQAILNDQIRVTLNGQVQEFKDETTNETQYPITYHDRTYLPLRTVANLVGVEVDYDAINNTAMLTNEMGLNYEISEKKPIIYAYPLKEMELTIKLGMKDNITCSYPKYQDGWNVIAYPDGTLIDKNTNKKLYALYWEGKREKEVPMNDGFVVKGEDSAKFLEEKLAILGLNEKESEEFIIYWLPKLKANEYNLIRFETMKEIEQNMPIEISQEPDTLIRVWMQFKGLETSIEIPEQHLESNSRVGFTVVEWGGSEIK